MKKDMEILKQVKALEKAALDTLAARPTQLCVSEANGAFHDFQHVAREVLGTTDAHKVDSCAREMLARYYMAKGIARAMEHLNLSREYVTKGMAAEMFADAFNNFEPFKDENNG